MTLPTSGFDPSLTSLGTSLSVGDADPIADTDGSGWSPDNWLVNQVEQLPIPTPTETPRVRNEPNTVQAPRGAATSGGQLAGAIDAAMGMLGKQYVWGGTTSAGVDCSGLIYYAFKQAGFNLARYRAVDYGHMGTAVDPQDARPGDIVYFDNPNTDTDHVGIYLGNGKFIESPQPGERVQVSPLRGGAQIRRIVPESAYAGLPTSPSGNLVYNHQNTRYTGAKGPGPQRDPLDIVDAIGTDEFSQDLLGINTGFTLGMPELDPTGTTVVPKVSGGDAMQKFLNAVAGQESGGNYTVQNSAGAIGKYQVMYYNVASWTLGALGRSMSPQEFRYNPQAQEAVARWRLGGYVKKYGWRGAAAAWYSGSAGRADDYSRLRNRSGPSVGDYVDQVMARMGLE